MRWFLPVLSPLLMVTGCLAGPSSSPAAPPASPRDRSRPVVASSCAVEPSLPTYRLGADNADQPVLGNGQLVVIRARIGERFVIVSRFAQRGLTPPVSSGDEVRSVCTSQVTNPGGGTTTTVEFEAVRAGHAQIESSTDDCGPCANFALVARVTVTR